jgi:7-cyano-7-deazaguanine reductase
MAAIDSAGGLRSADGVCFSRHAPSGDAMTKRPTPKPAPALQLGQASALPASPAEARLDRVPNPHPDVAYLARFTAPEFTSLCPVTGQPDFGILVIDYVPADWLVESKSLKLYLGGFRNHGAFHEDCTIGIGRTLTELLKPRWLRIGGYWYPRGGIPIDVFWQTGAPPKNLWLPDQGVAPYRAR